VALGIVVDDTVHVLEDYRERARRPGDRRATILAVARAQSRPIVVISAVLSVGFSTLGLSRFVTLVQFGLLSVFVLVVAMVGELLLTPLILTLMPSLEREQAPAT
jgi:predicted RND superfamily exporter protein